MLVVIGHCYVSQAGAMPVCGVPVAVGAGRHMALGVLLVSDVHVTLHALSALCAIPVKHLDLRCPCHRQEGISCMQQQAPHPERHSGS